MALLDGAELAGKAGVTFQVITVDDESWPHVALLSVGELLVPTGDVLLVALWPSSRTTANLKAHGRATLTFTAGGAQWLARLHVNYVAEIGEPARSAFRATLDELRRDEVPYATLTSGITFALVDPDEVLPRWERTLAALRSLSSTDEQ